MNGFEPKAVGYACCYVPAEIILAAGFLAERIIPEGRCAEAEGYAHPNTCCFLKSMLADAVKGAFSPLSAVILANSCDGMRKTFDLWNAFVDQPKALFLDIPKKQGPESELYFRSILKRLGDQLSSLPVGKPVTSDALREAIRQVNQIRSKYWVIFEDQKEGRLRGSDVYPLLTGRPGKDHGKSPGLDKTTSHKNSGKKIFIIGNMLNDPALISMIEPCGGAIIGFDTCFGRRHYEVLVDEGNPDPWEAIARRYLTRPQCARMMGIQDQIAHLEKVLAEMSPDGVIVSKVKFCDNLSFNIPQVQKAIEAAGAKYLFLENDYAWSDKEKIRIKVEAFLEMMG